MTIRHLLIAICFALAPTLAFGDDAGPHGDVHQIRGEARTLIAARARAWGYDPRAISIDDVVVAGNQALAQWHAGNRQGIDGYVRMNGVWWVRMIAPFTQLGEPAPCDAGIQVAEPLRDPGGHRRFDVAFLGDAGFDATIASGARAHLSLMQSEAALGTGAQRALACDAQTMQATGVSRSGGSYHSYPSTSDGYVYTLTYGPNDAPADEEFVRFAGRRPTDAEIWGKPGQNAYFYFTIELSGSSTVQFRSGNSLYVWFPFVLDSALFYNMTIGDGKTPIGPITGTLYDNALRFDLPPMAVDSGATLRGEIDGNPWHS